MGHVPTSGHDGSLTLCVNDSVCWQSTPVLQSPHGPDKDIRLLDSETYSDIFDSKHDFFSPGFLFRILLGFLFENYPCTMYYVPIYNTCRNSKEDTFPQSSVCHSSFIVLSPCNKTKTTRLWLGSALPQEGWRKSVRDWLSRTRTLYVRPLYCRLVYLWETLE